MPKGYARLESALFEIGQVFLVQYAANRLIGDALKRHRENGVAFLSTWRALGVGLLAVPVVLLIAIVLVMLFPNLPAFAD